MVILVNMKTTTSREAHANEPLLHAFTAIDRYQYKLLTDFALGQGEGSRGRWLYAGWGVLWKGDGWLHGCC